MILVPNVNPLSSEYGHIQDSQGLSRSCFPFRSEAVRLVTCSSILVATSRAVDVKDMAIVPLDTPILRFVCTRCPVKSAHVRKSEQTCKNRPASRSRVASGHNHRSHHRCPPETAVCDLEPAVLSSALCRASTAHMRQSRPASGLAPQVTRPSSRSTPHLPLHLRRTNPPVLIALICTTRRRIPASVTSNQGPEKGDLIPP